MGIQVVTKLKLEDNIKTKPLYTQVFNEDTKEFIDYYYSEVARYNTIYTVEDKAMLHLNPYEMSIYGNKNVVNYIVAVATTREYRKQGLMRRLMERAIVDMYKSGEAFTYLMPASEAIYEPYDFVVIGEQTYYRDLRGPLSMREADVDDSPMLSEFAQKVMESGSFIYTERTPEYFTRIIKEQRAQNGGVRIFEDENTIVGVASYANEGELKFRDVIAIDEKGLPLVYSDSHNMMARIINLKAFLANIPTDILRDKGISCFNILDEIIGEQTGNYQIKEGGNILYQKEFKGTKIYTISEITKLLFENTSVVLNEIV